jgi:PAS domain S-box-containing protein
MTPFPSKILAAYAIIASSAFGAGCARETGPSPILYTLSAVLVAPLLFVLIPRYIKMMTLNRRFAEQLAEQKLTGGKIIKAKKDWEQTFDAITDPIMLLDRDRRILRANKAMAGKLGVAPSELVGLHCCEAVHGLSEPPLLCPYTRLLNDGRPHSAEIHIPRFSGDFLISVSPLYTAEGKPNGGIVHYAGDITVRKQAETELFRVNRTLKMISACNHAIVHVVDERDLLNDICRVIVDIGGYCFAWVGYAEQDGPKTVRVAAQYGRGEGYLSSARITWSDDEHGRGPTGTAIRTGEVVASNNITADPHFGPWREHAVKRGYASSIALPFTGSDQLLGALNIYASAPEAFKGDEIGMLKELADDLAFGIMVVRTRAGRKQAQEQLEKLNQELEQRVKERTSQLEAANRDLEAFSYSVSHDLRAPLRRMTGFVELLGQRALAAPDEQGRHYAQAISDSAAHMGKLIDELLAFSRMGRAKLNKTPIVLTDLIQTVIGELCMDTEGRDVAWDIKRLPVVYGDPMMLRLVFDNLISNALKFTRNRAQGVIEIGPLDEQPSEIGVYIRDNGIGFDMAYAHKLFGLFQRLHRPEEYEGTGVGLANVQRIVQRHGGRVWAESAGNNGATFFLSLPTPETAPDGHAESGAVIGFSGK